MYKTLRVGTHAISAIEMYDSKRDNSYPIRKVCEAYRLGNRCDSIRVFIDDRESIVSGLIAIATASANTANDPTKHPETREFARVAAVKVMTAAMNLARN